MKSHKFLYLSYCLNTTIGGLIYPILTLYMEHISEENYFYIGIIVAIPLIMMGLMSFGWGAFSDYLGERKRILIITTIIGSLLFFIFPYVNSVSLIILRIIQVFFLSSIILLNALMTEYFPKKKGTSLGNLVLFQGIGWAIGGTLSGFLVKMENVEFRDESMFLFFYICGIISLLSALVLIPIKEVKKKKTMKKFSISFDFGERKQIWLVCITTLFLFFGYYMVILLFPIHLENLDAPTKTIGYFVGLSGLTSAIFAWYAGKLCDRFGRKKNLVGAIVGYCVIMFFYTTTENIFLLGVLWTLPLWPLYVVASTTMVSDLTSESERGRGVGLLNLVLHIGCGAGALVAGVLAGFMEFREVFIVGMVFTLVSLGFGVMAKESLKAKIL